MTKTGIQALTLFLMAAIWTGSSAQSSSSCTNVLISMSPCLDYITGNSSKPSSGCCSQLGSVVNSQPQCLCQVLSGSDSSSLGININRTQALQLPAACKVQTPSISRCTGAGSTTTTTSTGSKGSPSVDTSEGHAIKFGFALFASMVFIANFARDLLSII